MILVADAARLPLPNDSVDLIFESPPYCDARTYGIGAQRKCREWVDWMLGVVTEGQRVCRGPVIVVAAGVTRQRNYQPACEGLMWEWWKRGGTCQLYRPCVFHRVGIPGSGGRDWFRADWEYIMCFKRPGALPWAENTAMGHIPKWAPGGEMSYRDSSGRRRNQWGHSVASVSCAARRQNGSRDTNFRPSHKWHTKTLAKGERETQVYVPPVKANPGNVIKCVVGGGCMGSKLAHENEAPFPESLAEFFIRSLCPPGGVVLDRFSGSGTTAAVAKRFGRQFIACDIRQSQADLTRRRVAEVQMQLVI